MSDMNGDDVNARLSRAEGLLTILAKVIGLPDEFAELFQALKPSPAEPYSATPKVPLTTQIDLNYSILLNKVVTLSAETHEWLALQSLGLDGQEVRVKRFTPMRIYYDRREPQYVFHETELELGKAVEELAECFEFEISDDFPPLTGSWFKKWFLRTKEVVSQPEVAERLQKAERALVLKGLALPQANVDEKQAAAVAKLLKSVEKISNCAIQVGSILLIKVSGSKGPTIQVRTLTQAELLQLENNQSLLSSPADLLDNLTLLCAGKATMSPPITFKDDITRSRARSSRDLGSMSRMLLESGREGATPAGA